MLFVDERWICMSDIQGTVDERDFQVIEGKKELRDKDIVKMDTLKVFKTELVSVDYSNIDDLFSGFDSIKAITFSYDIDFMDYLMQFFKYGEIVLGADFMVQKDRKLNDLLEVAANNYDATQAVKSKKRLVRMLSSGDLNLRAANYVLDHRKIYLLRSDNGRTRVIKASANMSGRAWNGEHIEHYEYDDSTFCYEEYEKDFETAWLMSNEIPYTMVAGKKSDDYIEGNPVIKKVKETNKVTVVQTSPEPVNLEITKFMIDHTRVKEDYKEIFSGCGARSKGGIIELKPRIIEKVEMGLKKLNNRRRMNISITERAYPNLTFEWNEGKAFVDGSELDLHPAAEDVCKDIDELMQVFQNFEMFVDETGNLQSTHFKFMNFIFQSPFHAKLRCELFVRDIGTMSLPMFALETSETANSGKTFMTNFILKMMTGETRLAGNNENAKLNYLRDVRNGCIEGFPYFVDEINGASFTQITKLIKDEFACEEANQSSMPVIIMAGNDLKEPDEKTRKRMVFFRVNGSLPSTVDQNGLRTAGNAILNRMGTALYREYLGRMMTAVTDLIEFIDIEKPQETNDMWYPDLVNISSKILLEIFRENGYDIPSYMKELEWDNDYYGANYIAENTIRSIKREYEENPGAFLIERDIVKIEAGGADAVKKFKSWENTLPAEMRAKSSQMRDGSCFISMNRKELEDRLGFKFKKHILPFFRKRG